MGSYKADKIKFRPFPVRHVRNGSLNDGLAQMVAEMPGVQLTTADAATDIARAAELNLAIHHVTGSTAISVEHGDIDWYTVMSDRRGEGAAMSIEYGRSGFINTDEGEKGEVWGQSDALWILHDAAMLPRKQGPRIPRRKASKSRFLAKMRLQKGR